MNPYTFLAEITPFDTAANATVTVRMSFAGKQTSFVAGSIHEWLPLLTKVPEVSYVLQDVSGFGGFNTGYGNIGLRLPAGLFLPNGSPASALKDYDFDGAMCKIWMGDPGADFSTFTQIMEGRCGPLTMSDNRVSASVIFRGPAGDLDKDLLSASYAGTGGAEGPVALKGVLKPWCSGVAKNVTPILINNLNWTYQYHGYGETGGITNVFENAISLGAPTTTVATYAALAALTLAEGTWAAAPAVGMFRLGSEPTGDITADVTGAKNGAATPTKTGAICAHMMNAQAGINNAKLTSATALDTAWAHDVGYYVTSQVKVWDAVSELVEDVNGYMIPDGAANWVFGRNTNAKTPTAVNLLREAEPLLRPDVELRDSPTRAWKVRVGGDRNWTPNSGVSDLLKEALEALESSVVGVLTNDSHNVPADSLGTVSSWSGAGGTFQVYYGSTDVTTASAFSVASSSNLTATINPTTGVYSATAMSADTGSVTFSAVYNGVTVQKTFNVTKSKAGSDGSVAPLVTLSATHHTFSYAAGASSPNAQTTTFTAQRQNTSTTTSYNAYDMLGNHRLAGASVNDGTYFSGSGDVLTMTHTQFQAFCAAFSTTGVTLEAVVDGIRDRFSVVKVQDGATGAPGEDGAPGADAKSITLSATHNTFPYDSSGAPKTQSTTITAVRQNTSMATYWELFNDGGTGIFAGTAAAMLSAGYITSTPNNDTIVVNQAKFHSYGLNGVTFRASITDGVTVAAQVSLVKVSDGAAGADGAAGTPAVTCILRPESLNLPCYANGGVTSFAGASTTMQLLVGATDVSSSFTLSIQNNPQALTTTISSRTVNITGSGSASGQYDHSDVNFATLTIRASGTGAYAGLVFDKVFTLGKSRGGYELVSSNPATNLFEGRVVYNTTDNKLYTYNGSTWVAEVNTNTTINANQLADGTIAATKFASTIEPLVIVTSVPGGWNGSRTIYNTGDNRLYQWNGTAYVQAFRSTDSLPAGQVTGQLTNSQIADVAAAKVSGQLTNAQIADIAAAKVTGTLVDAQLAGISTSKLSGTIADAQIAAMSASKLSGQITATQITDGAISTPKLAANAITADKISANSITTDKLVIAAGNLVANSAFETGDLTNWSIFANAPLISVVPSGSSVAKYALKFTYPGSGTQIASVFAAAKAYDAPGADKDGFVVEGGKEYRLAIDIEREGAFSGGVSVYAYFQNATGIHPTSVNPIGLGNGDVPTSFATQTASFVAPAGALRCWLYVYVSGWTSGNIKFTNLRCAQKASGDLIVDGAITAGKIATGTITATQIAGASITGDRLVANTITAGQIAANTITASQIAASTITGDKIAGSTITGNKLVALTITANEMAANSINTGNIIAGAVTAEKILANTITAGQIAANSITGDRLVANTITAGQIAAGAISATQIASDAITTSKLLIRDKGANLIPEGNGRDLTAWNYGAVPNQNTDGGCPTGFYLSTSANDFVRTKYVQIDSNKNYNVKILYRQVTGSSTAYLVVRAFSATLADLGAGNFPSTGSYNYYGLTAQVPSTSWTEYEISFGPNEKYQLPAGTKYVEIGALTNYSGSGTQGISGVRLVEKTTASLVVDGTLTTSKLAVTALTDNLIANPRGADLNTNGWYFNAGSDLGLSMYDTFLSTGRTAFYLAKGSTGQAVSYATNKFRVEPGRTYSFKGLAYTSVAMGSGFYARMQFSDANPSGPIVPSSPSWSSYNTANGYYDLYSNYGLPVGSFQMSGTFTAPSGASWASLAILNWTNGPTTIYFTDLEIREVKQAVHIENGAITADKVATNAITADKINAGAITAAKMNVTSLSAITANIGLLRTASSGARTEIENNQIRVYDSAGTLRVRMGIW